MKLFFMAIRILFIVLITWSYPALAKGKMVIKNYLGSAPMYEMVRNTSKVNLIFFNGGPGWWGNLESKNFLIRERNRFFEKGANIFLFPNAEIKLKMSYGDRLEDNHIDSIQNLVNDIKSQNKLPIFLVGISRGTVSIGHFLSRYGKGVDGAVLMSGIYYNNLGKRVVSKRNSYSMQKVIGRSVPSKILIIHHEDDGCKVCKPNSAESFYDELNITDKKLVFVSGGGSSGSPHGPFHHHGFEGVEDIAVNHVMGWALKKNK